MLSPVLILLLFSCLVDRDVLASSQGGCRYREKRVVANSLCCTFESEVQWDRDLVVPSQVYGPGASPKRRLRCRPWAHLARPTGGRRPLLAVLAFECRLGECSRTSRGEENGAPDERTSHVDGLDRYPRESEAGQHAPFGIHEATARSSGVNFHS